MGEDVGVERRDGHACWPEIPVRWRARAAIARADEAGAMSRVWSQGTEGAWQSAAVYAGQMILRLLVTLVAVQFLCGCGGPLSWRNATALHHAAYRGDTKAIEAALGAGEDPNAVTVVQGWRWDYFVPVSTHTDMTPLDLALSAKRADAVRVLMRHGARLNLWWVKHVVYDGEAMVRALLDGGMKPDTPLPEAWWYDSTALFWAVYYEDPGVVRLLLDAGADPNARDKIGRSPLMAFSTPGSERGPEVARMLLSAGADPVAQAESVYMGVKRGVYRETPISHAQDHRRADIEKVLMAACLERGIQPR